MEKAALLPQRSCSGIVTVPSFRTEVRLSRRSILLIIPGTVSVEAIREPLRVQMFL